MTNLLPAELKPARLFSAVSPLGYPPLLPFAALDFFLASDMHLPRAAAMMWD